LSRLSHSPPRCDSYIYISWSPTSFQSAKRYPAILIRKQQPCSFFQFHVDVGGGFLPKYMFHRVHKEVLSISLQLWPRTRKLSSQILMHSIIHLYYLDPLVVLEFSFDGHGTSMNRKVTHDDVAARKSPATVKKYV
jgi:hypothetical protein